MSVSPLVRLPAGTLSVDVPQLGLGVYKVPAKETADVVGRALDVGYRAIDTAALYDNELGVGRALARTEVPREQIVVTTKVWNDRHGFDETIRAFEESAARLSQGVDLLLVHWPCPEQNRFVESWRALLALRDEGRIRAVGVSNFGIAHLQRLMDETGEAPALNQVELHPYLAQRELRAFHAQHGIATQAWGPLARGGELLTDPVVLRVAAEAGATAAQVVLAWSLQQGNLVIPKSATPARLVENLGALRVHLSDEQLAAIDALDRPGDAGRTGPHPDAMN